MAETDKYNFDKEYRICGKTPPKIDLDRDPLVTLHKNVYRDLSCLNKVELLTSKRRANLAACGFNTEISSQVNPFQIIKFDCQKVIASKVINYGST